MGMSGRCAFERLLDACRDSASTSAGFKSFNDFSGYARSIKTQLGVYLGGGAVRQIFIWSAQL
tara:strand:+ start:642 stop:830 length:189 start_codon:yes stop_codon:yes gene_type:complete